MIWLLGAALLVVTVVVIHLLNRVAALERVFNFLEEGMRQAERELKEMGRESDEGQG